MSFSPSRSKEVFLAALECPPAERRALVEGACGGNAELLQEVESLLAFHEDELEAEEVPSPTPTFVPGTVFADRYRMITQIGQGGMGDVWRADDLVLETPVAL